MSIDPSAREGHRGWWSLHAGRRRSAAWIGVYLFLLMLVWGLLAADRGLFQDDVVVIAIMRGVETLESILAPAGTPTRRLHGLWSYPVANSAHPVMALQLLLGLGWLATGLVARQIARSLAPAQKLAPYLAGALTLCATSDFLTNSMVAVAYQNAILATLGAVACGLAWCRGRGIGFLVASVALLGLGLWTLDVGLSAVPFAPALFWLAPQGVEGRRRRRRLGLLLAGWAAVLVPYGYVLASALRDPQSYYARARLDLSLPSRLSEALGLWLGNFTPWRWVLDRPAWYSAVPLPPPIPWPAMIALALCGTGAFLYGMRAESAEPDGDEGGPGVDLRAAGVWLVLLGLAFAANAVFAGVQLAHLHYRTHLLSRVWISILLALAAAALARRWRWALVIPVLFVAFGVAGGIERQGFYTAFWREHQRELASLVRAAPALRPGTEIVLWVPPHPRYLATEAHYAQRWLHMLYEESPLPRKGVGLPQAQQLLRARNLAMRWSPIASCRPDPEGLACAYEGHPDWPERIVPYDRLLLLGLDPRSATYSVLPRLPMWPELTPAAYRPSERVIQRPLSTVQRRLLLLDHRFLVRWLPDPRPPAASWPEPGVPVVTAAPAPPASPRAARIVPPRVDNPLPSSAFSIEWVSSAVPREMQRGETVAARVTLKNAGSEVWPDFAHSRPPGHAVRLSHRWIPDGDSNRAGAYTGRVDLPRPLRPGEVVTLLVQLTAPGQAGTYELQFDLVEELVTWFEPRGAATFKVPLRVLSRVPVAGEDH